MAKERSKQKRIKRLENQYYRHEGNPKKQANLLERINHLENS